MPVIEIEIVVPVNIESVEVEIQMELANLMWLKQKNALNL